MAIPDLSDRKLFPPFLELPQEEDASGDGLQRAKESHEDGVYLVAQIKDNMTITKPTLVLTDRDGHPFALVFEGYDRDGLDLAKMGLRKGATAIVRGARRVVSRSSPDGSAGGPANPKDRRPIVRIAHGEAHRVRAVPASLDKVVAVAAQLRKQSEAATSQADSQRRSCDACGKANRADGAAAVAPTRLLRCAGCGQTWYCNRACQTRGWTDGHKGECKALRGVCAIWGREKKKGH